MVSPHERTPRKCVYVHADGKIILNGRLNSIITSRNIEIRVSKDGEKIALIVGGSNCHTFTKNGHTINKEIINILGKRLNYPLGYEMENNIVDNIWIGKLQKVENKKEKCKKIK